MMLSCFSKDTTEILFNLLCQKLALPRACRQPFHNGNCVAHTAAECDREDLFSAVAFGSFPSHFYFFLIIELYFGKIKAD